jgi:hypothetical protein
MPASPASRTTLAATLAAVSQVFHHIYPNILLNYWKSSAALFFYCHRSLQGLSHQNMYESDINQKRLGMLLQICDEITLPLIFY